MHFLKWTSIVRTDTYTGTVCAYVHLPETDLWSPVSRRIGGWVEMVASWCRCAIHSNKCVWGGGGSLVPQSRAALQHHLLDAFERCNSINDISLHLNVLRCHWCSAERVPGDLLRFEASLRLDLGLKVFCISATISLYLI